MPAFPLRCNRSIKPVLAYPDFGGVTAPEQLAFVAAGGRPVGVGHSRRPHRASKPARRACAGLAAAPRSGENSRDHPYAGQGPWRPHDGRFIRRRADLRVRCAPGVLSDALRAVDRSVRYHRVCDPMRGGCTKAKRSDCSISIRSCDPIFKCWNDALAAPSTPSASMDYALFECDYVEKRQRLLFESWYLG